MISESSLKDKESRIHLAEEIAPQARKRLELVSFVRATCPISLRKQLEDILNNQVDAPADVHKEVSMRPWDFV